MAGSELLVELREIREKLEKLETMLRFIIERHVEEDEPLPDEAEAIKAEDELVDLREVKEKLLGRSY